MAYDYTGPNLISLPIGLFNMASHEVKNKNRERFQKSIKKDMIKGRPEFCACSELGATSAYVKMFAYPAIKQSCVR